MSERPYHERQPTPERTSVQMRFGERVVTLSTDDTMIRRFTRGDGEYDHCVHVTLDGQTRAFTPDPRAMEELVRLGFPVRVDAEIDEATINHYVAVHARSIDDERDLLGL